MQYLKTAAHTALVSISMVSGLAVSASSAQAANVAKEGSKLSPPQLNHYVHFPKNYDAASDATYPLLIVLHGKGERGDTLSSLYKVAHDGTPADLINEGGFKDANGVDYPFVVVSPQWYTSSVSWGVSQVEDLLDYAIANYNVDKNRVYMSGLSMGGYGTWSMVRTFGPRLAAVHVMSAGGGNFPDCTKMRHLGAWIDHGTTDGIVPYSNGTAALNNFNACAPKQKAELTTFKGWAHDWKIWKGVYFHKLLTNATGYEYLDRVTEADRNHMGADGKQYTDVYRWMLTYSLGGTVTSPAPANVAPVANAGSDKTITLPTNSVVIAGISSDADGTISSRNWSQISGPNTAILSGASTASLTASSLVAGTYVFRFKVVDNDAAVDTDDVSVIVKAATTSTPTTAVIYINSDEASYFTSSGTYTLVGTSNANVDILGTSSDDVYRSERFGNSSTNYAFSANAVVPNGSYRVTLRFAEIWFGASNKRKFHVNIEGARVLTDFDIYAAAGGKYRAVDRVFTANVVDGKLTIQFLRGAYNAPKISGIKIEPL
jgi:poly(3-hydroxybutyrate) depolymerase